MDNMWMHEVAERGGLLPEPAGRINLCHDDISRVRWPGRALDGSWNRINGGDRCF